MTEQTERQFAELAFMTVCHRHMQPWMRNEMANRQFAIGQVSARLMANPYYQKRCGVTDGKWPQSPDQEFYATMNRIAKELQPICCFLGGDEIMTGIYKASLPVVTTKN